MTLDILFGEVPGYPNYRVGVCGTVLGPNGPLKPFKQSNGYIRVTLSRDGKVKLFLVHRLVLLVHEGPCPIKHTAAHRNGIRDDNRLENLYWATGNEQWSDKEKHGTATRGSKAGPSKLDEETVALIKQRLVSEGRSRGLMASLSREYGVSRSCIYLIDHDKSWRHV